MFPCLRGVALPRCSPWGQLLSLPDNLSAPSVSLQVLREEGYCLSTAALQHGGDRTGFRDRQPAAVLVLALALPLTV